MEGKVRVNVVSVSAFAGEYDKLTFTGDGILEKAEYGYHLRYHAENTVDGSVVDSDVKWERETGRAIIINETGSQGYGLLLDPKRDTATQIASEQGQLSLNVHTNRVGCAIGKREGEIIFDYTLLMGQQPLSALQVSIGLHKEKEI